MKAYRRGYRPPGAITRASCQRLMPRRPKELASHSRKTRSVGVTATMCAKTTGSLMRRTGVHVGKVGRLPPGTNLKQYSRVMRGAGYAVKVEDLRKMVR